MTEPLLDGIRAVEIGGGLAPAVAALLLAELGAEVVRIEPPSGDPGRGSAAFAIRNRSKRHVALDLDDAAGARDLAALLAGADLLIHDLTPSRAAALGLAPDALRLAFPQLVPVSVTAFPPGHPHAELPPVDSLALAAAGVLDEQAACRREGPVYLRFPLGSWGAAYLAAIGALAKLRARDRGAASGPVETSLVQGALTSLAMHWYRAERPSRSLIDGLPKTAEASLFECADGAWLHLMANADAVPLMAEGLAALPEAQRQPLPPTTSIRQLFPLLPANRLVFRQHEAATWLEALWAADMPVLPVLGLGELYEDAQAIANRFVVDVENTRQPAIPISTDPPPRVQCPAGPAGDLPEWAPRWIISDASAAVPGNAPLAGLRVLDFGNFLAGPFAMMLAADLGADVIKVEATSGDQMRWIDWGFNGCQRNKRAIALQLKDPRAREVLERLVRGADVVHHNLRMPAARKLGLDDASLRAINPAIIFCHVSSYGAEGPRKDWPGYDQLFQAASGWEREGAGEGNPPVWHRFGMMDHLAAMASLVGTLAALRRRERTGEGGFVGASLQAAAMMTMSETMMLADGSLTAVPRLDPEQTGMSLRDRLYRCADRWMALWCPDDAAWSALLRALPDPVAGFAAMPVARAVALAQSAGAHVVEVLQERRHAALDDPAMRAAGLVAAYPHPVFGRLEQVGSFWTFGGDPCAMHRAPPVLGQDTAEVLTELGFSENEIAELAAQDVVRAA